MSVSNLTQSEDKNSKKIARMKGGQTITVEDESSDQKNFGFDLSLLKRPSFVLLALSGFLCLVGFFIPFIYISDHAKQLGNYCSATTTTVPVPSGTVVGHV